MERQRKVYIINRGGHDFSNAREFGEFVYLSEGKMDRYSTARMYRQFADILQYSEEEDLLLQTGLGTMTSIASAIFGYLHNRINLLLYRNGKYIERTVVLSELLKKSKSDKEIK